MWHIDFINRCLNSPTVINDAAGYGVVIVPAVVTPGDIYYRIIGIHHLTPQENAGKRNLYLDVLDESGQRISGSKIAWGWQGQTPDQIQRTNPAVIDKPAYEPGGNISLDAGQIVSARVAGAMSDMATNIHTGHDDEPGGNTRFHHSFYVVWQRTVATGQPPVDPDPQEPDVDAREIVIRIGEQTIHTGDTTVVLRLGAVQVIEIAGQRVEAEVEDIVITIEVVAL